MLPSQKTTIKPKKVDDLKKKGYQKFWEIDEKCFGEMSKLFRETPKKVVQKFRPKFGPPVSEVLDPLVGISENNRHRQYRLS